MSGSPDHDDVLFTRKERIRARVAAALDDRGVRLSAQQAGTTPFFLTDHNFGGAEGSPAPLLVLLADKPFTLAAHAVSPRGLVMELSVSSAAGARTVARAHSFSTATVDVETEVVLDRWADGSAAALVVGDASAAERDGQGVVNTKAAAQVTVTPLVTVDAAGVRWTRKHPLWPMDRARRLAAALDRLPSSDRVHETATPESLDLLLADVEEIVTGLDPLDQLRSESPGRPLLSNLGAVGATTAAAGSPGAIAVLRHGDGEGLGGETPLPIRIVETGRETAWPLRFLACRNVAEMEFLRQVRPAKP